MSANKPHNIWKAIFDSEPPQHIIESLRAGGHTAEELLRMCAETEYRLHLACGALREVLHELLMIRQEHCQTMVAMLNPKLTQKQRDAALREVQAAYQSQSRSAKAATAMLRSRKVGLARNGGNATAKKTAAKNVPQNEKILALYRDHKELHELSGEAAASSLIDKYPEETMDLKISHRRVADLIRKEIKAREVK